MSVPINQSSRNKALLYTTVFTIAFLLLLFLLKWKLPEFEKESSAIGIDVEVNWPPDPAVPFEQGGGGGGNEATSFAETGIAPATEPITGEQISSKEIVEDPSSTSAAVPSSKKTTNKSKSLAVKGVKAKPQKKIETPTPPRPKAVMGKSISGNGQGGGAISDFERTGGRGNGWGAGNENGEGGGSGRGVGGGTGSGIGTGIGPRVTKGDRRIVKTYAFEGDLNRATLYVNILVSPEGIGKFVSFAKGSTTTSAPYRQAIIQYLEKMRFDIAAQESMVTVQFNFRIN